MNRYRYEEIYVGQKEEFCVDITEEMMASFRGITGDVNPMHQEDRFAIRRGFREKIVYGMLTASFLSTLAGVYLPGENCLIQSVDAKFVNPVYVGDKLLVFGVVAELHDCVRQIVLKVVITNQGGYKVLKGTMKLGVVQE